ncbi:MAG: glutathione S-transferase family protein [Gammaproteobacteria bacterium]|nr:glutathione S-transferase family protein [Gammaproteobacteria bacterium]
MTIKLYGIPGSRALRSIWAIEEVGVEYEHIPTSFSGDSKQPEYLAVNPNGRIPALQDGDLTLFQSMAINLYLAKTYGGDLYPSDSGDQARAIQWSVWGISEIEPLQMQLVIQKIFTPEDKRDDTVIAAAETGLERPLRVLDAHLEGKDTILGGGFSVADLNVAAVALLLKMVGFDNSKFGNVKRWADACYDRPALARAQAKGS